MPIQAIFPLSSSLYLLLILCCGLVACGSDTGNGATSDSGIAQGQDMGTDGEADTLADSQLTRGLGPAEAARRRMDYSLERAMPLVYGMVKQDAAMTRQLDQYARKVLLAEGIDSPESLEAVFAERDDKIIPGLQSIFERADGMFIDENWQALELELQSVGISMTSAEGMFTGLVQSAMLEYLLDSLASEPFRLYQDFLNADAYTRSGEYPFNDMQPYGELVMIGEQMKKQFPNNPYTQKVEPRFFDALEYMTDIHLVHPGSGMKQQGPAMVFVGATHTDAYPWITETGSRERFAKEHSESKFSDVMQRILENPSEIGTESENIYIIVTEWAKTREGARQLVYKNLAAGKDVPHYLEVRRGDGTDQYAIAYRFYEDEEKANKAFEAIKRRIPTAQLIFCSVKGDKLYQLGI